MKKKKKEYHEQFHANKFNNLDERHKLLERHKLPKIEKPEYRKAPDLLKKLIINKKLVHKENYRPGCLWW